MPGFDLYPADQALVRRRLRCAVTGRSWNFARSTQVDHLRASPNQPSADGRIGRNWTFALDPALNSVRGNLRLIRSFSLSSGALPLLGSGWSNPLGEPADDRREQCDVRLAFCYRAPVMAFSRAASASLAVPAPAPASNASPRSRSSAAQAVPQLFNRDYAVRPRRYAATRFTWPRLRRQRGDALPLGDRRRKLLPLRGS
jgi:hypothetical protein